MRLSRRAALALILALATAGGGTAPAAERLLVFAAASLRGAIDEVARRFEEQYASKVVVSFAASSTLARQIGHGAPADVYISANPKWMDALDQAKLLRGGTRSDLLGNRLVLVARADNAEPVRIESRFPLAELLGDQRLAMGDPVHVPAGQYGKDALEKLGVWDAVAHRVAGASNVRAALALVARGEAPYGIVYRTDAMAEKNVAVAGVFPQDSHPPIIYPVALTVASTHSLAGDFVIFLRSPAARRVFEAHGFTVLEP